MTKAFEFRLILGVSGCSQAEHTLSLVEKISIIAEKVNLNLVIVATESSLKFYDAQKVENRVNGRFFVNHTDHTAEFGVPHIELAQWADLVLVYPASANTVARCAHGFTDNLLSNIVMATKAPVYFGATMNDAMYESKAFQENVRRLKALKYKLIPREKTKVFIHSKKKYEMKPFCSENMVLQTLFSEMKKQLRKKL